MPEKVKSILITGAQGFVGRNLTEYFTPKYEIYGMGHAELDLLDAGAVKDFFTAHTIDIVLHCANVGGSRITGYDAGTADIVEKNLRMFFNLERALPDTAYMLHFGSGAEYDKRNYQPKMTEEFFDRFVPEDAYGYSKYLISKYIFSRSNISCLRIFGLYGMYEDYRFKFISNAIVKNLLHMPIIINQNIVFDYLFIEDLLRIVEYFITHTPQKRHYNLTPARSIDLVSLGHLINKVSPFQSEIKVKNDGMNRQYSGDNSRLLGELGQYKFVEYEDGIRCLYRYYESVLDQLDLDTVRSDPYIHACQTKF
ncbi:MAG: NAD-dependent epimerase/dehydratase family protein [Smithella sp.]